MSPMDKVFNKVMFTPEECATFVDSLNKNSKKIAKSYVGLRNERVEYRIDRDYRFCLDTQVKDRSLITFFMERIVKVADEFYGCYIEAWNEPSLRIYPTGGHFKPHLDVHPYCENGARIKFNDRDYSVSIFLNDDYEGGEFKFTLLDHTIYPQVGRMIMFPSWNDDYEHGVMPVTKGNRYQFITWLTFKGSFRNHDETKYGPNPQVYRKDYSF